MGTRVLSLWLPHLEIDRLGYEKAEPKAALRSLPRATISSDQRTLVALCPRAEQAGLWPGQDRDDALRRVPGLVTFPSDTESDDHFLQTCASWCESFTPFVAIDRTAEKQKGASLWLDIGSSAHLSGGEVCLLTGLLRLFSRRGVTAHAAIADHPGSAWAACRFGDDERRILPANGARVALAPLPIRALRLNEFDKERLESAGLDRIEHLYALPRRALTARFGDHVATRLDQALGLVDEPIAANTPLPAQQAQMIFADPITCPTALPPLIERLIHQLCIGLEAAGLGVRRLTLALYRVDNSTVTCSIGTDRPSRDRRRLLALIGNRFDDVDLGFGVERVILDAVDIEPLLPESLRWRGLGTDVDDVLPDLAGPAGSRRSALTTEDGSRRHDDVIPIKQPSLPPFLDGPPMTRPALPSAGNRQATALAMVPETAEPIVQETLPRPLRLFRQPEPIEAIASLPDEPPVLFRWRQRLHKVISARGPETVAPDWWHLPAVEPSATRRKGAREDNGAPLARDYFAVEDNEGTRFWVFREGRYGASSGVLPRWFLHGVFG